MLTGRTRDLRVRALADARTFQPVKVTVTETLSGGNAQTAVTNTLTITDYQRLPITPRNRKLLDLPAHPNVPITHFRSCPTITNSHKLCRSSAR